MIHNTKHHMQHTPHTHVTYYNISQHHSQYHKQLWKFVVGLSGGFNSYKVTVAYHQLSLAQSKGVYDNERFMDYLAIPRYTSYTNPVWANAQQHLAQ